MAITSNFSKFGVTFENAYTKVSNLEYANSMDQSWELSEDPNTPPTQVFTKVLKVKFDAHTYPNAESEDLLHTESYHVVFESGDDLLGSCYAHLKTLPEFTGAQDV